MAEITPRRRVAVMRFFQVMVQIGAYAWLARLPAFMREWRLDNSNPGWITGIFYSACTLAVPLPRRLYVPIRPRLCENSEKHRRLKNRLARMRCIAFSDTG